MDDLIAQDADLIDKLRDEDSYYRIQEKHWCIDAEELERQRLAAANRIAEQAAELAKWKALAETLAGALEEIERAPAWGYPDKWETTPAQVRILARDALTSYKEQRDVAG